MAAVPQPGHSAPRTQETIYVCCPDFLFVDGMDLSRVVEIEICPEWFPVNIVISIVL